MVLHATLLALGLLAAAEMDGSQKSVDDARKALGSSWSYPWYDGDSDSVRSITVRKPGPSWSWGWGWPWSVSFDWIVWLLSGLVLAVIVFFLVRFFFDLRATPEVVDEARRAGDQARIEALPFNLRPSERDLRTLARQAYEAGDYARAIIYLFSYQLVELDRGHLIELTRGKTNRQYLRDASRHSGIRELLEPSMVAFEDVYFGHRPLSQARFEHCWSRVDEFTALAAQGVV